jgi:hypothetical protein
VGSVKVFDHFHTGAAILGDLIDISPFHQAHADVGVPETVDSAALTFPIFLQVQLI